MDLTLQIVEDKTFGLKVRTDMSSRAVSRDTALYRFAYTNSFDAEQKEEQ